MANPNSTTSRSNQTDLVAESPVPTTTLAQRRSVLAHRKLAMKRLSILVVLVFAFLVLGSVTGVSAAAEHIAGKLAGKFVFFVHVAQLYTKDPDKKLAMPVQDVEKRQVANTWQAPRDGGRRHQGQDIFAPRGTPIFSATEGYVANIGNNSLGGQTVSVVGAGGRTYYYAHLEAYAPHLAEGDYVTRQTLLGYVGTTGNAAGTPPHLHFGVYAPGGALNPLPLLDDRVTAKKPAPQTPPARAKTRR